MSLCMSGMFIHMCVCVCVCVCMYTGKIWIINIHKSEIFDNKIRNNNSGRLICVPGLSLVRIDDLRTTFMICDDFIDSNHGGRKKWHMNYL